ncbi:MAG: right-handed parallel beta-helix repeat-containing protein [Sedimentisphaerales bacterium]
MKNERNLRLWGIISLLTIGICNSWVAGKTIYVDASTPDSNNGTSWSKAYAELQSALHTAIYGDQIRVADGTYLPDYDAATKTHTGSRTATFGLINGVTIYGGYAGFGAPDPNVRAPNTYPTILSGDLAGNDAAVSDPCELLAEPTRAENSYHVVTGSGTNSATILDGFIITGGNANSGSWPTDHGAGMFNEFNSSLRLVNCTFNSNSASYGGGMINHNSSNPTITGCAFTGNFAVNSGGGIENANNSRPVLTDCSFNQNRANGGGGIQNSNSNAEMANCSFTDNRAVSDGGAILNYNANPILIICTFNGNTSVYTGGAIHDNNSSPEIIYCDFTGNTAGNDGGGIYNGIKSNPVIENCDFTSNAATNGAGGGIKNDNSSPVLTNCSFINNSAGWGGGIINGENSNPGLTNCIFINNTASHDGGGINNYNNSDPNIANCTFNNNSAGSVGGAICDYNTNPKINLCSFTGNTSISNGGAIHNNISNPSITACIFNGNNSSYGGAILNCGASSPIIEDCNFISNAAINGGSGGGIANDNSNPMLTDCTFSNNSSGWGGGISNYQSSPSLNNCSFTSNTANSDGGGMYNNKSNPVIDDCNFVSNVAIISGGGIYNSSICNTILQNCTFNENQAGRYGGAMVNGSGNQTLTKCSFNGNTSVLSGGAINNGNRDNTLTITSCNFSGNTAGTDGGAILNYMSSPIIRNCNINSNHAHDGGAISCNTQCNLTIQNCTINNNSADEYGGGILCAYGSNSEFIGCTFSSNSAYHRGNCMYNLSSSPKVTNCILWDKGGEVWNDDNSNIAITYSDVQGGLSGEGNINADPLFVDADGPDNIVGTQDDNLRLRPGSPCLDAGVNTTTPPLPPTDLDGKPRIQNGIVDMGAYEGPTQVFVIGGAPVTIHEGGIKQFYISLALDPNGPVEVTVAYHSGDTEISVLYGSTLYFDSNNYDIPQPVTLAAAEDGNYLNKTTIIRVSAISIAPADVTATMVINVTMAVSPPEAGSITPAGTFDVIPGDIKLLSAEPNSGYYFVSWIAIPAEKVVFGNANALSTTATLSGNAIITANFAPLVNLTMAVSPPNAGTTTPSIGTSSIAPGLAIPIEAQANTGYGFISWSAIPAENAVFGNSNNPSTTVTISDNTTVTANFNSHPIADINATSNVVVLNETNSVTLNAASSADDGLPNLPGTLTYHWQKVSGPNTCTIADPNAAVTDVLFWGLGSYAFSVTVSDGQLQAVKSISIDVLTKLGYVANYGNDITGAGTIENPFETIQKGINTVEGNGTVIVLPGTYYENINFGGKKVTVRSNNPDDANVVAHTVIDANGSGSVVVFNSGEDANSVLAGFTITGGSTELGGGIYIYDASPIIEKNIITGNNANSEGGGIYCQGGSATIRYNKISNNYSAFAGGVSFEISFAVLQNNLIVDNNADYDSGVVCIDGQPRIVNNTIAGNAAVYDSSGLGIASSSLSPIISNNIIAFNYGVPGVADFGGFDPNYFSYNDVYGHSYGDYFSMYLSMPDQTGVKGNISSDPLFIDSNNGDFHLTSASGRWDPNSHRWVSDANTSPCIDAGDPNSDWTSELWPHGKRINMGAYGNTPQASMSTSDIGKISNFDNDINDTVDFLDFALLAAKWQQEGFLIAEDINRDGKVDMGDLAIFAQEWLSQ